MIDNYTFTKDKITQLLIKTSLKVHLHYDRGALYKYTEIPVIQKILDHLGDMSHESRGSLIERAYIGIEVDMDKRFPGQGNMNIVEALNTWYRYPALTVWHGQECFSLPPVTSGFDFSLWSSERARKPLAKPLRQNA